MSRPVGGSRDIPLRGSMGIFWGAGAWFWVLQCCVCNTPGLQTSGTGHLARAPVRYSVRTRLRGDDRQVLAKSPTGYQAILRCDDGSPGTGTEGAAGGMASHVASRPASQYSDCA